MYDIICISSERGDCVRKRGSTEKPLTENDYKAFEELETTDKSYAEVAAEFGLTRGILVYRYGKYRKAKEEAEKQKKEGDKNGG